MRTYLTFAALLLASVLAGCANGSYYLQSIGGHMAVLNAAKPVDQWLASPQTPHTLKARLELAQRIRHFAVTELGLPDNASYQRYADLHRSSVVWNVVAAPPDSLTLKTWCFAVAGCVGYRGYYAEDEAMALAAELQDQGLEVSVYGVPAYSTLGWMNWAGGDPLLNTFIHYPEGELARLIFHELAHQVLYVKNDTAFNESFATAVERMGTARWLALNASPATQAQYASQDLRRTEFRALTRSTRQALAAIYASKSPLAPDNTAQAAMKLRVMEKFKADYATLKTRWSGTRSTDTAAEGATGTSTPSVVPPSAYDHWVAKANNAAFGALAAYDEWVPSFEALFQREAHGQTDVQAWQRFFEAVRTLAQLPAPDRALALGQMVHTAPP